MLYLEVLRDHSWQSSKNHLWCQALNLGQVCARQDAHLYTVSPVSGLTLCLKKRVKLSGSEIRFTILALSVLAQTH